MTTGIVPVGDPAPDQINQTDPPAEETAQQEPDYAAQLREAQKALDKIKADYDLAEQKAKFWHEQATSRPISTESPRPPEDPFSPLGEIDGYDLLTKEGAGLPAFARVFKEKAGFVTLDDVKSLIAQTVQEQQAQSTAMASLVDEFPDIRSDKAFQDAVKEETMTLANDPYFKALPDIARLRIAAANVEIRRLRAAPPKVEGETEAQRVARIAAQSAPKGTRPPAPADDELNDDQKKIAAQIGLDPENFKKYGRTLNWIGGRP